MKKLLKIGSGMFIHSIIPILMWLVLSHILKDTRIANVFSITYALQFVEYILKNFFGSAANIKNEKEHDENAIYNSMFWGAIISSIIFAIPLIFVDNYINFYGLDIAVYKKFVLFSIALLLLQTLLSFIIEKFYFEDKENKANIHLFCFNLLTFILIIILCSLIKNTTIALAITISILFVYILVLYIKEFKKFKIKFDFFKNFKYESANIIEYILMLIIYLFGFKTAFSYGAEYLAALNIIGLCTDTQWDMLYAVNTMAKVDISKNRLNYKKSLTNSFIYALILSCSSVIMALILVPLNGVAFNIAMVYLAFQFADMNIHSYRAILSTFTQLEYSATLNTVINFVLKGLRTLISVVIISPYCTEIAQILCGGANFIIFAIIRFAKYKVVDEHLTIKPKKLG